jgi:methyl-accepting chemotaxis protein
VKGKDLIERKNRKETEVKVKVTISKIISKRVILSSLFSLGLSMVLILYIAYIASSSNIVERNISVIENVSRPDEYSEWEDIQEIKNDTNRSLPMITIGGLDTLYGEGDTITIYAAVTLHGEPIDPLSYCNVTITRWNGSTLLFYLNSTNMTRIFPGWYYLNWTSPTGEYHHGTYGVLIEADPIGRKTQATTGFRVGFTLNVSVTIDTSAIEEQMDCDGVDDSPVCNYTKNLNNITAIIQDMLNCSNQGNQSDLCNYTDEVESKLDELNTNLLSVNLTIWNKLLTIESAISTVNSYVDNISEALDCDTSTNDVCTKINEMRVVIDEINSTTHKTLGNVTWMLPQISDILSNVTDIKSYVETLINEFNCSSQNPSDVCYRLELIQNYTNPLAGMLSDLNVTLKEINTTTHNILDRVNTINSTVTDILTVVDYINNTLISLNLSKISEMLDCDGNDDSPICGYTDGLQSTVDIIQDMLNCSNLGANSDLCNYTQDLENNLTDLHSLLLDVNITLWNKLDGIEATVNTVHSFVDNISEALDCDTSTNDVCKMIQNMRVVVDMINSTTQSTLSNVTWMVPKINEILANLTDIDTDITTLINEFNCSSQNPSDVCFRLQDLASNISLIRNYAASLIDEFNCTSVNPSDVCYRLQLIENYSVLIDTKVSEINRTTHSIWTLALYLNDTISIINASTSDIRELLDCDGIGDSPLCGYTDDLQATVDVIQDMLNCSNAGANSDICNYTDEVEGKLDELNTNLLSVNLTIWNKLLTIEATTNTITSYVDNISEALDCDTSTNDVCTKINELKTLIDEINLTSHTTLDTINSRLDEINSTTYETLNFVKSINASLTDTNELLDCDGTADSPICDYTDDLQTGINKIIDMLNCSNEGNNSDLCGYIIGIRENLSELTSIVVSVNQTLSDKLVSIESTMDTIYEITSNISEALDCDNSTNDVCNEILELRILIDEINGTARQTFLNLTQLIVQMGGITAMNISQINENLRILSSEFNCSLQNPSDVCYRLSLIQGYTQHLESMLLYINKTTYETLTMVNYINEVKWGNFSYTKPIPTVLILQGKIKQLSTGNYLAIGSIQVNITDAYVSNVIWSHEFDDVIEDGIFNILLGGTYDLSLIPKRKYRRDISICDGITFDSSLYTCETFTTYFIA